MLIDVGYKRGQIPITRVSPTGWQCQSRVGDDVDVYLDLRRGERWHSTVALARRELQSLDEIEKAVK